MIFHFVLLFGILLHLACAHVGAPDSDEFTSSESVGLRYAMDLREDPNPLFQLTLFRSKDDEGLTIEKEVDNKNDPSHYQQINRSLNTYVLFNGHPSNDSKEPFQQLKSALFNLEDANLIEVFFDWTEHKISFLEALKLSESLGMHVGIILESLDIRLNTYHFFGHCIGAEIATATAKHMRMRGSSENMIARLTAFDPFMSNHTKISRAGGYVKFFDVYHAGIYMPAYPPIGNVDFYPNAGISQPGCGSSDAMESFRCHHQRSIYLYVESLKVGVKAVRTSYSDKGDLEVMDEPEFTIFGHKSNQSISGAFYLPTAEKAPYLINFL